MKDANNPSVKHMDYDPRTSYEEEMHDWFKKQDYSNARTWKPLFSNREAYIRAVRDMGHPFHAEALQIRKNRQPTVEIRSASHGENDIHLSTNSKWSPKDLI